MLRSGWELLLIGLNPLGPPCPIVSVVNVLVLFAASLNLVIVLVSANAFCFFIGKMAQWNMFWSPFLSIALFPWVSPRKHTQCGRVQDHGAQKTLRLQAICLLFASFSQGRGASLDLDQILGEKLIEFSLQKSKVWSNQLSLCSNVSRRFSCSLLRKALMQLTKPTSLVLLGPLHPVARSTWRAACCQKRSFERSVIFWLPAFCYSWET